KVWTTRRSSRQSPGLPPNPLPLHFRRAHRQAQAVTSSHRAYPAPTSPPAPAATVPKPRAPAYDRSSDERRSGVSQFALMDRVLEAATACGVDVTEIKGLTATNTP